MIDLETLVARVWELEGKYFDLQERYQLLIHQYEQLKEQYADSAGHRNGQQTQYNTPSGDAGH